MPENKPNIFQYIDYRLYLRRRVEYERSTNHKFSFRFFSKEAGFKSPSFLKMVMDGKRNLSLESISIFNKVFKHSDQEAQFFSILVVMNQSDNETERDGYFVKLKSIIQPTETTELDRDKYSYISDICMVILRELVALPDFSNDPEWIAARLSFPIEPNRIKDILDSLFRLELIKKDNNGLLSQAHTVLKLPGFAGAMEAYSYHGQALKMARDAMINVLPENREFTAITIPLQKRLIPKIRDMISNMRNDIVDLINSEEPDYDEVYQINFQCFPVTKKNEC